LSKKRHLPAWLAKRIPSHTALKQHRFLQVFGPLLRAPYLWHFHRHNVVKAISIGVFCANLPMPFQMIPACALAILWRANLPISVAGVWITNPLTMPFILVLQYQLGAKILGSPALDLHFTHGLASLTQNIGSIWKPLLIGAGITAVITSTVSYFVAKCVWNRAIRHRWRRRHH